MLATLLNEIDGVGHRKDGNGDEGSGVGGGGEGGRGPGTSTSRPLVLVIGTTNREAALDAALLRAGRLEVHVRVDLPDADDRASILRGALSRVVSAPDVSDCLPSVAMELEGCSCAQVGAVVPEAALAALSRGATRVERADVEAAAANAAK
jgi:ATP-dependent 26S proteasome regulatory subunit